MRTPLSPAQIEALRRSYGQKGFGYFLDMGLGKTFLALTEFNNGVRREQLNRLVVVCPNSFKGGWLDEIDKHGFNFDAHILEAARLKHAQLFVRDKHFRPTVLIINYEAIRLPQVMALVADFAEGGRTMLAVDESIAVKNPQSKRTKAVLGLAPLFERIRCLTGKPMTQGPQDLWAQLRLCGLQDGRNFYAFRNRFCRMGGWQGREVIGALNTDELQHIMEPITFQALKDDWLDGMPDKVYTIRRYALGEVLTRHYNQMRDQFMTWLADNREVSVEIAITKYIKLAQIQAGFIIEEADAHRPGWATSLIDDKDNPRLATLLEVLDESSGKVAICFKHRFVGEQLYKALATRRYHPAILRGGMEPEEIAFAKTSFNSDKKCRAILLQIQASKFGHTLLGDQGDIADACSTMIFYENSYSLDDRSQIEDRIHRIGQKQSCLYVDLVGSELDMDIIHALQRKESMYEAVMRNV